MTAAKDPFEEFLRKKKVEMLEKQYRHEGDDARKDDDESFEDEWASHAPRSEKERDQRVEQEMNEFFDEGGRGGAELFERAKEIDEERVEEIKDALDDVFEEPKGRPEDADDNETFVDFFKQVQTDFEAEARETVQPAPDVEGHGPFEDEPQTADFPLPGEEDGDATDEILGTPLELESPAFPEVEAAEDSEEEPADAIAEDGPADEAATTELDARGMVLAEILTPPKEGEDLRQRVDLLSRIVVKLVERAKVPESELIEVLIKSGVEF